MGYLRTNIEINEELVGRVMRRHNLTTKKDAVDFALNYTAGTPLTQEFLDEVHGMGWGGDLHELRDDPIAEW
jgi:Arc/MetJ family transcription regulator